MMELRYSTRGLSSNQAQLLTSKLMYSIEGISDCYFDQDSQEVVVNYGSESMKSEIVSRIQGMADTERHTRALGARVLKETEGVSFEQTRADLSELYSIGYRRDFAVSLYNKLDDIFLQMAVTAGAKLRDYSSLITRDVLNKCNYITTFPQNVLLVSEFPHDLPTLQSVGDGEGIEDNTRASAFVLSPAVCFHCYEELSDRNLTENVVLTAKGNCFRHEAPWRINNYRLNEFSMREIVFIGNEQFVQEMRSSLMESVWILFTSIGFYGRIVTATDPFYLPKDSQYGPYQMMADMKYELVVQNDVHESFSIASFNNSKNTLCKAFRIHDTLTKQPLHSGCVAFGVDRWIYALLSRFGTNIMEWPEAIVQRLKLSCEER